MDRGFCLDVAAEHPRLHGWSLDCALYGGVLERLADPEAILVRHRRLLRPGGCALCWVPNVQDHTVVAALFRGDLRHANAGLLDATRLGFFTYATASSGRQAAAGLGQRRSRPPAGSAGFSVTPAAPLRGAAHAGSLCPVASGPAPADSPQGMGMIGPEIRILPAPAAVTVAGAAAAAVVALILFNRWRRPLRGG